MAHAAFRRFEIRVDGVLLTVHAASESDARALAFISGNIGVITSIRQLEGSEQASPNARIIQFDHDDYDSIVQQGNTAITSAADGTNGDGNLVFDPPTTGEQDILAELLSGVEGRGNFFDARFVDPQVRGRGSSSLRSSLARGFDPTNAAFEITSLLGAQEGDQAIDLPEFNTFASDMGGIPSLDSIRNLLKDLVRRQRIGQDPGAELTGRAGSLSGAALTALESSVLQNRLIRASGGARQLPGFLRNAFGTALNRRISQETFANPGGNVLGTFVDRGFRL
jgi:hypothetical protein